MPHSGERTSEVGEASAEGQEVPPEHDKAGAEGSDRVAAAAASSEALGGAIREFTGAIEQLTAELRSDAAARQVVHEEQLRAEQVLAEAQQTQLRVDEMLSKGAEQNPGSGFAATAHAASARSGTKYARKRWPGRWWDTAWEALQKVFPLLWSIIANLLKVQQWTVTGQVGIPVLGMAQAGISVTFG
jgi:hypothetical protein